MASNGKASPYDLAVEAVGPTEKARLQKIRLAFNESPDSPMWGMYALLVPPIIALQEQLTEDRQTAVVPVNSKPRGSRRWPLTIAAALAGEMLLLGLASFSGAVAQWTLDTKSRYPTLAVFHLPWLGAARATIATWPVLPFVVATAALLVLVVIIGLRKSGPASKKVWPRGK